MYVTKASIIQYPCSDRLDMKYKRIKPMKTAIPALSLLLLLVSAAGAVDTGLPSTASVPSSIGIQFQMLDTTANMYKDLDLIKAAGCKFVRQDIYWTYIEKTAGTYTFSTYDTISNACASRGLRVIYDFCYGNGNGIYSGDMSDATFRQHYADYAAATAAHFRGRGNLYELWNEPNNAGAPCDSETVSNYTAFVSTVAPAIRAADSSAPIIAGAVNPNNISTDGTTGYNWLASCFQQGMLNHVDAVSIHPYANPSSAAPEKVVSVYSKVRGDMQTYGGKTVPLLDGEWGYSTCAVSNSNATQGDHLARSYLVNLSQGIPLSIWYAFRNLGTDSTNWEYNYGTIMNDYTIKPAYEQLQLLTTSLQGETFTAKLNDGRTSDWLLVFTAPNGQKTLAAWTTGSARYVRNVTGWGAVNLTLTGTPQYLNPSTVPEPGALFLVCSGALGIAIHNGCRRMRSKHIHLAQPAGL